MKNASTIQPYGPPRTAGGIRLNATSAVMMPAAN